MLRKLRKVRKIKLFETKKDLKYKIKIRDNFIDKIYTENKELKKKVSEQNLEIENLRNALEVIRRNNLQNNTQKEKRTSKPLKQANSPKVHK